MVEKCIEVFIHDFFVFGDSFTSCLNNLERVLERFIEKNLVLNWQKSHFMVTKGILIRHKISARCIDVDQAKIEVIEKLPPPQDVKGVRTFLGQADFYRRFKQDFSKIARPLSNLLVKENSFHFNEECLQAFDLLKKKLVTTPAIVAPNWGQELELMCDATNYVVRVVLGQKRSGIFHAIYYANKMLNEAQINCVVVEKEMLAVVYAFKKF